MNRPHSTERSLFRYCPFCSTAIDCKTVNAIIRPTCLNCGYVQFRNPVVGVAAVIFEDDAVRLLGEQTVVAATGRIPGKDDSPRILLARRTTTYRGFYCLPCGYVEFDEDVREALAREIREEAGLVIEPGEVLAVHSNFHDADRQSVGIWFRGHPVGGTLRSGDDVDTLLFAPIPNPGVPMAFPTDEQVLADLARQGPDRRSGRRRP